MYINLKVNTQKNHARFKRGYIISQDFSQKTYEVLKTS